MTLFRFVLCVVFGFVLPRFIIDASRVAEGLMLTAIMLYLTTLTPENKQ